MNLEAVVTCVNFADFLAHTLPTNRSLFNRIVVVTAPEDKATQRICEYWHCEAVLTDAFNARWGEFNKGAGINAGLAELSLSDWVVHLDADIMLPPLFPHLVEQADLDKRMLYGADRFLVQSFDAWSEHWAAPQLQQEDDVYVHTNAFPLGTRVASSDYGGYIPIGFFQMWNPLVSGVKSYPVEHTNAGRSDMIFTKNWARAQRASLPEVICYHLESEQAMQGTNWSGRQSKSFANSANILPAHHKPHHHHHKHHRHHYGEEGE